MTTQTSFSDKNNMSQNRRFFNTRYFKFRLKTGWPLLVVFVFVFILSMAVPSVSYITETLRRFTDGYIDNPEATYNILRSNAVEFLYMMGTWNVVISMFGGLLCGLTTMGFTNNKVAVNFYHSLPMRREALFITSTLQSFIYYVAAFAAGLLLVFSMFSIRFGGIVMFVRPVLITFWYGVLFFFLVYAMTLFAASLTGTGFMRFIGAAYVVFLPVAMFVLFIVTVGSCGIYNSILDIDYYLSSEIFLKLCTPLRLINLVGNDKTGEVVFKGVFNKEIVIVLVTAIVMYGLAFLLYCIRHSESASKPVIWKPAAFVFKYASVFMGGTLFALMFYGMFGSIPWMIFGIIIGSTIVFMLVNGILNKSARSIFKGLKGFGIYMAVMAVITVLFYCDVFGIFASVPDGSFVNKIELCINYNLEAEYGGDFASKVTNMIKEVNEKELNNGYYSDSEMPEKTITEVYSDADVSFNDKISVEQRYSGYRYNSMPLKAVFHTKLGIPYAVRIFPTCEDIYDLVKYIYDTGKADSEIPTVNQVESGYIDVYLNGNTAYNEGSIDLKDAKNEELVGYINALSDPTGKMSESPIVGIVSVYLNNEYRSAFDNIYNSVGWYKNYYIHANDYAVLNEIILNLEEEFGSEDDVIDFFIEKNGVYGIYVVDNDKNERIHITDADAVRDIVKSMYSFNRYYDEPVFCTKEHRYNIFIQTDYSTDEYYEDINYYDCTAFRKGYVPALVTELFGS